MSGKSAPEIVAQIDALLPQTQCTRCGYSGCKPYAAAIVNGDANINQCPPGGSATIAAVAALLDRPVLALNPTHGLETPPHVAWIDETRCIGCARCLAPCPVDAIIGAAKYMHTVLIEQCTGCELCLPACPVDCIELKAGPPPATDQSTRNRRRFLAHEARLLESANERRRALDAKKAMAPPMIKP